jgi:hypothetical protein
MIDRESRIIIPIGWLGEEPIMAAIGFNRPIQKGLLRELARFLIALEDMADEWEIKKCQEEENDGNRT